MVAREIMHTADGTYFGVRRSLSAPLAWEDRSHLLSVKETRVGLMGKCKWAEKRKETLPAAQVTDDLTRRKPAFISSNLVVMVKMRRRSPGIAQLKPPRHKCVNG